MKTAIALTTLLATAALGCAPSRPFVWIEQLPPAGPDVYRIAVGDRLTVVVAGQIALSGEFEVLPTGGYIQPVVGEIMVVGQSLTDAEALLKDKLKGIVNNPTVTISVRTLRLIGINVLGEVRTPGTVQVAFGEGLLTVLARAGGLTEFANESAIYVIRQSPELLRIRFRYRDLIGAEPRSLDFKLSDGDIVVVE